MKWCCEGLKYLFERRFESTIFVFAEPPSNTSDQIAFWLGMRSVEHKNLEKLASFNFSGDIPITIATRIPMKYCITCGKNLSKFYKKNYEQLVDPEILKEFL